MIARYQRFMNDFLTAKIRSESRIEVYVRRDLIMPNEILCLEIVFRILEYCALNSSLAVNMINYQATRVFAILIYE
jgi:hypothetical protein